MKVNFYLMKSKKSSGFTIKESNKMGQAHQTRQEQNLLCNVDGKMEDCSDQR